MTDYRDYGYADPATTTGFLSCTRQICMEIDDFRQTSEMAIDRNTAMIKEQHTEDRINFTTLFNQMRKAFFKIFTKSGEEEDANNVSFYEMVQKENDDTQEAIAKHQAKLSESITADTATIEKAIKENTSEGKVNVQNLITQLQSLRSGQTEIKNAIGQIQRT